MLNLYIATGLGFYLGMFQLTKSVKGNLLDILTMFVLWPVGLGLKFVTLILYVRAMNKLKSLSALQSKNQKLNLVINNSSMVH